ncbi:PE family protein [Gordonia desulfuricans]|uniref:PE family protein n=1 Tax=Gordonia desulfuricans TaxID=89051 RepID=A0A7K3LTE9_9ACTN|nr:PE family protein [Gordonia desulfuricans]NDK91281.1 PE family protein [Gordonia desulfuricans]
MSSNRIDIDPDVLAGAAAELDTIADALEAGLTRWSPALDVPPSGRDEVSVAVAHTVTEVAGRFGTDAAGGVVRLRALATAMRDQARGVSAADDAAASGLRATPV